MPRMKKKWKRIAAAAACVVLLVLLGMLLFQSRFVKQKILSSLQTSLEKSQGIQVSVGSFGYNLLKLRFSFKGVRLQKLGEAGLPPVFQAEEIKVNIPLSLLLKRRLRIQEIEIINPEIRIEIDEQGSNNFPFRTGTEKSAGEQTMLPDFLIEHFEARNARIILIDKRHGLELGLSAVWVKGGGQDFGTHSFLLEMRHAGTATFHGRSLPVGRCVVQAELDKGGMNIQRLLLALANSEIEFAGRIGDFSSFHFTGSARGHADVGDLRSLLAVDNPFSGQVEFQSNLDGPIKGIDARINLKSEKLSYGKIEKFGMRAELSWKKNALEILSFDADSEKGEVRGKGTLHPLDWNEGSHLDLEWKNLDIEPLTDFIQSPYPLSAMATGSMSVSWRGFSRDDITGACDIRFAPKENREHPSKGTPIKGRIAAKADSGKLDVTHLSVSILDAELKGKFHLSPDELSGDFGLEVQSVGKMTPLILAFAGNLEEKDVRQLGLDGPVSITGTLAGQPKAPSIRFRAESENLHILEAKNLRLSGTAGYDMRSIRVESLLVEDGEGRVEITGTYPLEPAGQEMRIDIEGTSISAERILEIFGFEAEAKGLIQVKAKVGGTTEAPRIESKWSVSGAALYGGSFGRIELAADYQNGRIGFDSLRFTESTGTLEASGFYELEREEFGVRMSGKSFPIDGLKAAENLDSLKAELDINFEAHGTLDDPNLKTKGRIRRISLGARALPDLGFEAQSEQDGLRFKIEAPEFASSIDGTVPLKSPFILRADMSVDRMRFEELKDRIFHFEKHDLSGFVTADAHLSVDLGDPQKSLAWEAKIEQVRITSGDRQIRNDGPILLSFRSETFRAERLLLTGTGTRIEAEGSLPLKMPSDSKISLSAEMDLALLNDFLPVRDCKGSLKMDSLFQGSLSDLEVAAVLDLSGTGFRSLRYPLLVEDVRAHIEIDKNLLRVDSFSGQAVRSRFGLKGELPLGSLPFPLPVKFRVFEEKEAKFVFDFTNLDPSALSDLAANRVFPELGGTISGRIEVGGKSLRPEDITAAGRFETFELDISGISLKQDSPAQIFLERGVMSIGTFSLRNGENRLTIRGTAGLAGEGDLDLSLDGAFDMRLLSVFLQEGDFSGKADFQIIIAQTLRDPEIQGFLNIRGGRYQRISPRLLLEQVDGEVRFKGNQVEIQGIQGVLNEGKAILSGRIGLEGLTLRDAEIVLRNEYSLFDYPKGLHSQVSGDLKLLSDGTTHQLTGTITILDARYMEDFRVGTAVFNLLKRGSVLATLREPDPYLKNLNFNLDIAVANDFIIDNNIAKTEVSADLKLIGTPYNPSLSGRANVAEGGEVYFNKNTFFIEQGMVDFINPVRIEPDLNLSARTQVQEYDIRLIVQGTPDKLSASLASDPPLSEPNIISLLVMGRTLDSASAHVLSAAGSTALSYLNNAITGRIEQATARALGLESVRIDAGLVSTEENPEARITLGQHLSRDIELVFSQDLKDTRNQMWMVNYNPYKSFNIQGIKRDNNEFNLALRHEIQFGLKAVPRPVSPDRMQKKDLIMRDIRLEGRMNLPETMIFRRLKLKKGRNIDFARFQDALERIRKLYRKNDYLGFSLAAKREESEGRLDIILHIESGPRILLEYKGAPIPRRMKRKIVDTWVGSPFGQLALNDIEQRIRGHFIERRYYEVEVRSEERKGQKGERILAFHTVKGPRYGKPNIRVTGNKSVPEKVIAAHLEKSGVKNRVFFKPTDWVKSIEDLYISRGYLRPAVQIPVVQLKRDEKKADFEVALDEGTRFKVENVEFKGLQSIEDNRILGEIGIRSGDVVAPERFNQADYKIHELYVEKGFNDVRVRSDVRVNTDKGTVDLNIDVQENQKGVIAEIRIQGNTLTGEKIVRREMMFDAGDVLNFRTINETRKRLYDLGVFERVNIDVTPMEPDAENLPEGSPNPANGMKYFRVVISVAELKPYRLRYGFQYDTESSFGILANLVNRNFLGRADLLGASIRLNRDERDARAFFRSPYFLGKKLNSEWLLFHNRIEKPAFTVDRTGFTLQQQMKIKKSNMISYNYTYEKIDTLYPVLEGVQNMDTTDRIGTLNMAFTRDTRDDILDATRGMFLSQSIRYAPGFLGSNAQFVRYFGQYNTYQRLSDFLTYAVSVRLGLGKGLNGDLPPSERFFAGGGTTIRGFKKDELGPKDFITGLALGGDAVFILNQELRFHIFKKFGGVVFLDLGNVYPKIPDFDFTDLRKTAGFGFRLHTPFVLVRFDWGFKLDRRPGETLSQIFFSIGQAF